MTKTVFVVTGSEDGIIGVYTSERTATEACGRHMRQGSKKWEIIKHADGSFWKMRDGKIEAESRAFTLNHQSIPLVLN